MHTEMRFCYQFTTDIYHLESLPSRNSNDENKASDSLLSEQALGEIEQVRTTTSSDSSGELKKVEVQFAELSEKSSLYNATHPFPTTNNLIKTLATDERKIEEIVSFANQTHPMVHEKVIVLMKRFIEEKRSNGSVEEQKLYHQMSTEQFVDRLLHQRPLTFITKKDYYLLRDGSRGKGRFDAIGTEDESPPLTLENYISYPEMEFSALLGVSAPTNFINRGWRNNRGEQSEKGTYEERGIYIGLVGARLEKPGFMEWKHMIITPIQNTKENGYGQEADPELLKSRSLNIWADFYRCGNGERFLFPSYDEALIDTSGKYLPLGKERFLNVDVYKQRIRMIIEPFLLEANARACQQGKKAYVHAVGFGLGVWKVSDIQGPLMMDVYNEVIKERDLSHISDINFGWFPEICTHCGDTAAEEVLTTATNQIKIHFLKRNPAMKLEGEDSGKLLVASYAWDSNSYPGNEYWLGSDYLAASGDPAAASCSMIVELQNPEINPNVSGSNTYVYR